MMMMMQLLLAACLIFVALSFVQLNKLAHLPPSLFLPPHDAPRLAMAASRHASSSSGLFLLRTHLPLAFRHGFLVSSPAMAAHVLKSFNFRSRSPLIDILSSHGQDLAFADHGDHWRSMRRIASLALFTHKAVARSSIVWTQELRTFLHDLAAAETASSTGILIRDKLYLLLHNITYRMLFGTRFESRHDPTFVQLQSFKNELSQLRKKHQYGFYLSDPFTFLKPLLRCFYKDVWEYRNRRLAFLQRTFFGNREAMGDQKHAVDFLLEAQLKGEVTELNVLHLVQNLDAGAIETTTQTVEWGITELVKRPDVQRKLFEEAAATVGEADMITHDHIDKLPYLQATVKETLRKHMPLPLLLEHKNPQPAKLERYEIPAGSPFFVNAWGIANDPQLWNQPEEFRPERFMEEKIGVNGNDARFIPFGCGRRICPGRVIALSVIALIIGNLVQSYELMAGNEESKQFGNEKAPIRVLVLRRRQSSHRI